MPTPIGTLYVAHLTTGSVGATLAAGTDSAGHVGTFQWTSTTKYALIRRMRVDWLTTVGFTAAQEVGFEVMKATGYSAPHSGGTKIVGSLALAGDKFKRTILQPSSAVGTIFMATTAELTDGTHDAFSVPLLRGAAWELATGAAVAPQKFSHEIDFTANGELGFRLTTNEGLVLRNGPVAFGGGGKARLFWLIEWAEIDL